MIAVLFEVWPAEGKMQHYLDLATALKADYRSLMGSYRSNDLKACQSRANFCRCPFSATRRLSHTGEIAPITVQPSQKGAVGSSPTTD
jgi:hypothetical protein